MSRPDPAATLRGPADASLRRERLSALADGQPDALDEACAAWAADADARAAWHRWHLIGDVMRSEDLASTASRDEAFLARLRTRLADEPVVLAPQPQPQAPAAARARSHRWLVPVAAAAGFVAVAGVLVVTRLSAPGDAAGGVQLAGSRPGVTPVSTAPARPTEQPLLVDGQLLRDARLDQYLRAHREMLGSPAAAPGGALRNVDTIVPQR